jgi:tetratricopeptide (TPR) repeat protein
LLGRISEALLAFDREKTLQLAQKYIEKRKYDRAILEYQRVVEHEPNDARTLLRIGDLQSRLALHAEAIATYDRVALYYAGRGFSLKAVAVLKQIGELIDRHAPQLADQYSHVAPKLAQLYAELGLTNDALATYDAVARRLQTLGRDRDAIEIVRRMVSLDRNNPLPYLRLAEALCRVSHVDEAVEHFWSAAQLLTQQARPDDSLKVLERMLHFRHDVRVARVAAEVYLAKGTREAGLAALSRLQLCFEADPRDLETLTLLARAFDLIGQPSKGVEVYKEMARIARDTGQEDLYQRYMQHLLVVAPDDEDVRALAARASERSRPAASRSSGPPESLTEEDLEFIEDEPSIRAKAHGPSAAPGLKVPALKAPSLKAPSQPSGARFEASAASEVEPRSRALAQAEELRSRRLYAKAAATLRAALAAAPQALELRAALQQVLLDTGDHGGAVEQMLAVAQHYAERGSLSAAEAELYQVLELVPEHPAALVLLEQIEALGQGRRRSSPTASQAAPSATEHEAFELKRVSVLSTPPVPAGTAEEPLPSYELEDEDLLDDFLAVQPPALSGRHALVPANAAPAEASQAPPAADEPLPQFSLDSGLHVAPDAPSVRAAPPLSVAPRPDSEQTERNQRERDSVRAAVDEAQFFVSRGLYQDASSLLRDRLEQYPGDPVLLEALRELEPKLHAESGTRDVGRLSDGEALRPRDFADEEVTSPSALPAERAGDAANGPLGRELRVQFSTDGRTEAANIIDADLAFDLVDALEAPADQQIDVDEVFAKFKQGVQAQVADNDSATHYDLGVAYKEMGLAADAIREFEVAARDPKRECNCQAMIGMMHRERGELDRAAEAYVRGLGASHKTVAQEISLYYELGTVYEAKDDVDEAIYYYQRISRRDPSYRDVSQRLAALLPRSRRFSQPARAINDDQEFDRSFDDLYKRD